MLLHVSDRILYRLLGFVVAIVLPATTGCSLLRLRSAPLEAELAGIHQQGKDELGPTTQAELQAQVTRFADQFATMVAQATDEFRDRVGTREARTQAQSWKVSQVSAAFAFATGPKPIANLLDLIVLVTLARQSQEDYWVPQVYGEQATSLVKTYQALEADIWAIATRVLKPRAQQELRDLLQQWRVKHPGQRHVAFMSFHDFGRALGKSPEEEGAKPDSPFSLLFLDPLAGLEPPTREVRQSRYLAERGMQYIQRMPTLLRWHMELLSYQVAEMPESRQLLAGTDRLMKASDLIARTAAQLPQHITEEREAAIKQALAGLSAERRNLLRDLAAEERRMRVLLADLRQTAAAGTELATSVDTTVKAVDALTARLASRPQAKEAPPFDIKEYSAAARDVTATVEQLNALVASVDQSLPQLTQLLDRAQVAGEQWINRAVRMAVIVMSSFLVGLILAMLAYRYLAERWLGSNRTRQVV